MTVQILRADARKIPLADASVDCIVTSPPYWGLRDYNVEGQIGLEESFDAWLDDMVNRVAAEWWRVLKPGGTVWCNMGDSYATGTTSDRAPSATGKHGYWANPAINKRVDARALGLKPKDLIGQPWRLAFALQAAGWYLRSDIIWHKPAPMPESVTDRPTKAHEYIFLLTKREHYYFDQTAWLEPCSQSTHARVSQDVAAQIGSARGNGGQKPNGNMKAVVRGGIKPHGPNSGMEKDHVPRSRKGGMPRDEARAEQGLKTAARFGHGPGFRKMAEAGSGIANNESYSDALALMPAQRNRRTVWTVPSQPTSEAHFATFPEALVEPCLLAGCPRHVCSACGVPWEPVEEKSGGSTGKSWHDHDHDQGMQQPHYIPSDGSYRREPKGYFPRCECKAPSRPGVVFDPFGGSGTTMVVANRMGLNGVMTELNPEYIEIARRRIFADVTPTAKEKARGQKLLLAAN